MRKWTTVLPHQEVQEASERAARALAGPQAKPAERAWAAAVRARAQSADRAEAVRRSPAEQPSADAGRPVCQRPEAWGRLACQEPCRTSVLAARNGASPGGDLAPHSEVHRAFFPIRRSAVRNRRLVPEWDVAAAAWAGAPLAPVAERPAVAAILPTVLPRVAGPTWPVADLLSSDRPPRPAFVDRPGFARPGGGRSRH